MLIVEIIFNDNFVKEIFTKFHNLNDTKKFLVSSWKGFDEGGNERKLQIIKM